MIYVSIMLRQLQIIVRWNLFCYSYDNIKCPPFYISLYIVKCFTLSRHHRYFCEYRYTMPRQQRPSFCNICPSRIEVFSNTSYGPGGPARWFMETFRVCGLGPQTSEYTNIFFKIEFPYDALLKRIRCICTELCINQ